MTAKVPTSDIGSASAGMMVARRLRRNRKITITTRQSARKRVNFTSFTDAFTVSERSFSVAISTEGGIWERSVAHRRLHPLRDRHRIGARLPLDREHHRPLAVEPAGPLGVLHAVHHPAEISQPDRRAVAVGHDQAAEAGSALVSWPWLSTE